MSERDQNNDQHWHLDKRISIGHLLTTMTVAVGVIMYAAQQDTRISLVEQKSIENEKRIDRVNGDVTHRLEKMDGKLDRLLERMADRP